MRVATPHHPICRTTPFPLYYIFYFYFDMSIQQTKEFLAQKPVQLSLTDEHKVVKRKWWAVALLIIGGVILAGKLPLPLFIPYVFFFFGHGGMLHSFWNKRDIPMVIVNGVWLCIDILGVVRWF